MFDIGILWKEVKNNAIIGPMIDPKEIEKLSVLARVGMSDSQKKEFPGEIEAILGYVGIVDKALKDYEPVKREDVGLVKNVLREDGEPHASGEFSEDLLNESPNREGDYVKVKKIL